MIEIDTGDSNMSDWKLNRMKKSDIIALFRETEQKLFGFTTSANKAVVEIEELNERIDDHMIQEDMNKKTINELNESNKKLMEKIKFHQVQKENGKKRENKISDYFEKGMLEKVEGLESHNKELEGEVVRLEELCKQKHDMIDKFEKEKEELIQECKDKNEKNELLEEEVQKWKEQVDENYKHHYDQFEPVLLENEKLTAENNRFRNKMMLFQNLLTFTSDEFESILKQHPNPNVIDPLINEWITDCCEELENDTSGVQEIAPTELDNLYCDFKEWAQRESHDAPKRFTFKENLKIWQANSRFGLDIGEKKSDAGINGYEAKPRFNLKVI